MLHIKPKSTGKAAFLAVYRDALEQGMTVQKQDPKRLYNLRCSQLPYCASTVLLNYGERGMYFAMDMLMAYYVSVGHAVHKVMQDHLAQTGAFLADYTCRECGTEHRLSHVHECCGFPTDYEEVSIDYKGIQGHIDAIFKDKQGRYWIVDFKTTSLAASAKKEKDPGITYMRQVTAYAYLLWKQHGIKVAGCMLIFIPRDDPKKPTVWEIPMTDLNYAKAKTELLADRALHKRTMAADTLEEFLDLMQNKCGNDYCDYCKKTPSALKKLAQKSLTTNRFPIKKKS